MAVVPQEMGQTRWSFARNQDIILAVAVMGVLAVLVIPIPTALLDILLAINISLSVVVLLTAIYLQHPVDFAVFPSLLLMLTLFRLSLNVASTRLILSQANAGSIINAFGSFVTSGSYIVGIIIFVILVVIQLVVITRGATRISEVAARFTLDAMPGKQMGVDADLNAGLITEDQARARRQRIEQEADFYGAMDGATKFVRGDAIAGVIITLVNIIGGLTIGVLIQNYELADAARVYTQLTVGDGLVSQIPALIVSMAAGLIVTRTASQENLGVDMGRQLGAYPRALGIASGLLVLFGIVPGMPAIPFFVVGIILAVMAYQTQAAIARRAAVEAAREVAAEETGAAEGPERTEYLLPVDPLKIELGYGLIALADPKQGGDLLNRIQIIRQQMATRMGFIVPVVRIVDNMRLRPSEYRVKLREAEIARYELLSGHYLAMNPGIVEEEIAGIPTTEPAFGLQALWVSADNRDRAERMGYTIVEPSAVLATHLTELITAHAPELLTRQDVQNLVNVVRESARAVVEELTPNLLSLGEIQKVLQNLLRERVSIRNLETILEVLADFAPRTRDAEVLTEYARQALARQICAEYVDERNALHLVTLAPELEREILDAVRQSETGEYIPLAPARADALARKTVDAVQPLVMSGQDPIVLTSAPVRRYFRRIVERFLPRIVVLSYNEVDPAVRLESEGQVNG
ncbi:MAG TPA: flagellar biosynthesis protein FlhA [Candidatus Hydrogenedentes bacterium]|jgi:flagellar biosynthesis protein FlhA|nr:flagellar biosynthesis protein FlhA [FCB group bacterium]HNZ17239.1 flagellar biosynthesis protein FlhA [Candidatus Hydrogenedentota bacterium]HOH32952.1 flagellar biosynthesis protein FlhA [Candidatus Hydrogenedentota bacterium]